MSSPMKSRQRRQRKNPRSTSNQRVSQTATLATPPERQMTPMVRHTFRFQAASTTSNGSLTVGNFFGICGVYGTVTNSTVNMVASSIKINRISIYSAAGGLSSVEWLYPLNYMGPDRESANDMPTGITTPSRITSTPPKQSLANDWINTNLSSSTALANLSALQGSIIDVDISWTTRNVISNSFQVAASTVVVGTFYYLSLDGPSTHVYTAIGLPTTF